MPSTLSWYHIHQCNWQWATFLISWVNTGVVVDYWSVELWEVYVKHFLTDRHDLVRKAAGLKQCHESSTFPWYHGRTYDSVFDIEQSFSSHQYTSQTLKSTCWSCYLERQKRFFRWWEHPSSQIWQQQVSHARMTQLGNDVISIWVSKCLVLSWKVLPLQVSSIITIFDL